MRIEETTASGLKDRFSEVREKVYASFSRYYNIERDPDLEGVDALAEFHLHDEQYFLMKQAKLSEAETHEFVYFVFTDELTGPELARLCDLVWAAGLAKAVPRANHRSSDVSLIVVAQHVTPEASQAAKKMRRSKAYKLGFWGYSQFRLVVYDLSAGRAVGNPMGDAHGKAICNILKHQNKELQKNNM